MLGYICIYQNGTSSMVLDFCVQNECQDENVVTVYSAYNQSVIL